LRITRERSNRIDVALFSIAEQLLDEVGVEVAGDEIGIRGDAAMQRDGDLKAAIRRNAGPRA
jgi:hypothetical protein